ncbi:MAG: hypothetical protein E6G00_00830 [Actinobacteria bacterium]|nr:MAG: hypothetical protein E6G29_08415 [Actinomycetota bacterium]TMM14263.1 MAG: hypothetical protein E6G00_00830 [Actinomycetota bacterium]
MADFLTEHRNALEKRLKELRPLYDEYLNLERVKDALQGVGGRRPGRPRGSTTRRRPGRPRGATTRRRSTNGRRRRGRRGGTRAEQALKVVRDNPGITVTELASKMNIKQKNYLYRVMNQLHADGAVTKRGRGYTAKK